MGQCICKDGTNRDENGGDVGYGQNLNSSSIVAGHQIPVSSTNSTGEAHVGGISSSSRILSTRSGSSSGGNGGGGSSNVNEPLPLNQHQRLYTLGLDVRDLINETLNVIRTLVNNEQEPPPAMLKLNIIADKEQGWLLIVQTMIDIVPIENPLGPAVVTLFLDESPLPTKETVSKLLFYLNLSAALADSKTRTSTWHRNVCIVLGCIAEKLAGPNSVATFKPQTLEYLIANLASHHDPNVILFSMIALEKYAQTSENKVTINKRLVLCSPHPLEELEIWMENPDYVRRQIAFCAQWALDNLFTKPGRAFSYETVVTTGINVMLNHNDVSEYLKISPNGLEARCDVSSFESVRCTFQVNSSVWYYEAVIITTGVMQIGWATKDSKFLNHEGCGIGDDEYSVAYDGCRQLIWHNASCQTQEHPPWRPGDVLGCLLDLERKRVVFYLNGVPLSHPHIQVFQNARSGFFAAASFMSFQQCKFNFGNEPFRFAPPLEFETFNNHAILNEEQRVILPRHKKLEILRDNSVAEGACSLCFSHLATVTLKPCNHSGFCTSCAMVLDQCPLCRGSIDVRSEDATNDFLVNEMGSSASSSTIEPIPAY